MKAYSWIPWLLVVVACLSSSEARYKMRRPLLPIPPPPPLPQMIKKSWPITHRVSMGNTIHINNNFPHKRPVYIKPNNFRMRRPLPNQLNTLSANWKNQISMSPMSSFPLLPQRAPPQEFKVMKVDPQYSPEYKPEPLSFPSTHRGGIDDDKGPIHTIPAPNLSIADKPYNPAEHSRGNNNQNDYRRYPVDSDYTPNDQATHESQQSVTNPTPTQSSYQVTEANNEGGIRDYPTVTPTYFPSEFESSRVPSGPHTDLQSNEVYINHPSVSRSGVVGTNIQFAQPNVPMQTNLHSSLHVGFPASAAQAPILNSQISELQQNSDLHVGHPAMSGPPIPGSQFYDLFNNFPKSFAGYSTGHQPQLQQHILQQQLGQLFQPEANPTTFSQPQMHSFNYDEQSNKQQQQQILVEQDYASGRVTADYNLQPEQPEDVQNFAVKPNNDFRYQIESVEQPENNIEYEAASENTEQVNPNNYFDNVESEGSIPNQFYTTLPNRETAEKLAALAAAGSVNSHLIQQLQKKQQEREQQQLQQQQQQEYEDESQQNDEPVPNNHKGNYQVNEQIDDVPNQAQDHYRQRQQLRNGAQKRYRQHYRQQQIKQEQEVIDKHYERDMLQQKKQEQEDKSEEDKRPLRIMVPEVQEKPQSLQTSLSSNNDYDYDTSESDTSDAKSSKPNEENYENISSDFGSRIKNRSRK
ncbi:alpha-protein kinase 1-like [Chelonus insularis]|uniref:alpha-protein kinase 1-like n=1 Tax=Chelonus insularis TaxID=460826 RepID=UPI00158F13C2|nr:alpha-protein kinase 1-like [Chelonus insularis]